MIFPYTHITTDTKTSNGIGSCEIYRCIKCKSIYQIATSEIKVSRRSSSRCCNEGFHIGEYCCSSDCVEKRQSHLTAKLGFNISALFLFGQGGSFSCTKNSPAYSFVQNEKGTGLRHRCKNCSKRYLRTLLAIKGMRKHEPHACSPDGPHWKEFFCGSDCMHDFPLVKMNVLGFKKHPPKSGPFIPSYESISADMDSRKRVKNEKTITSFLMTDFKGRIVVQDIKDAAQWLYENKSGKYTQKQLIDILKR